MRSAIALLSLVALVGCGKHTGTVLGVAGIAATVAFSGVGSPKGGTPASKKPAKTERSGLSSCEVTSPKQLAIVRAFEASMHELVVCGGMSARFSVAFYDALINVARGKSTHPKGFVHLGGGRYRVGNVMVVSLHLPRAMELGAEGAIVPFDVFDISNYFAGARISIKAKSRGNAEIALTYDQRMPGAELLGNFVGNNGRVTLNFRALVKTLGSVRLKQEITVADNRGDSTVNYRVEGEPTPIRNLVFAKATTPFRVLGARAHNAKLDQTLTVTDFQMAYAGGGARTLDGKVSFVVRSGEHSYRGTFVYPHRSSPDVTLSCM
jgi:hypothetical protein